MGLEDGEQVATRLFIYTKDNEKYYKNVTHVSNIE